MTDALQLAELALQEPDGTRPLLDDLAAEAETLTPAVRTARATARLTGPLDHRPAVLRVHSADEKWADALTTMYLTWSATPATPRTRAPVPGAEGGRHGRISVIAKPYAYGRLRREAGLHRLPGAADAVVEILPLTDSAHAPAAGHEIRVDTLCTRTRTTSLRLLHLPTGTSVHVSEERNLTVHTRAAHHLLESLVAAGPLPPPVLVRDYDSTGAPHAIGRAPHGFPGDLITARLLDHPAGA